VKTPGRRVQGGAVVAVLVVLVLVAGAVWWFGVRNDGTPAQHPAFPRPLRVDTSRYRLERIGNDQVTAWRLPERLLSPRDVLVAANGTVWLTEQNRGVVDAFDGSTLTRHDTSGFEYAGAFGLARGPGGAVWFSGYPSGAIGRVLPDGRVNVFAPLLPGAATIGIVQGPDDAMWIADTQDGMLVRISSSGRVDSWPIELPHGTARPRDLTAGTDDALWFTDAGTDAIGRATPNGDAAPTVREFPTGAEPRSIAVAPDGSIWATVPSRRALTTVPASGGQATIVPVPGLQAEPNDLAFATDGTIWLSQQGPEVLHIRADGGLIERFRLPGHARYADGLAVADDGSVWAAATDADLIVRISGG